MPAELNNPERATGFIRQIEQKFKPLRHHPELGPRRDTILPGLRALIYRDYVIYYRVTETALIIVRVLHGARDTVAAFGEDRQDLSPE